MVKFCVNCGIKLEEGQVCICQQTTQQQQGFQPPITPVAPSTLSIYMKSMWSLIMGLIKAPATVSAQFTNSCDIKLACVIDSIKLWYIGKLHLKREHIV